MSKTQRKNRRTLVACLTCRKRKIKCSGLSPCSNCLSHKTPCVFPIKAVQSQPHEHQLTSNVNKLIDNLKLLLEKGVQESNIADHINVMNDIFENISVEQETSCLNSNNECSRESFYRETLYKGPFSNYLSNGRLFDGVCGMFSSYGLLHEGGRVWLHHKYLEHIADTVDERTRDAERLFFSSVSEALASDYRTWHESISSEQAVEIFKEEYFAESFTSNLIAKHSQTILSLNKNSPLYTEQYFTALSKTLYENSNVLKSEVKYLNLFCFWSACCQHEKRELEENGDSAKLQVLAGFESSLFKLSVYLSKASFFSTSSVECIVGLVEFLKMINSRIQTPRIYSALLAHAINMACEFGIHRIEFYVGLSEKDAELRRTIFWNLYVMDKLHFLRDGSNILIQDDNVSCLLPKKIDGIATEMDFKNLTEYQVAALLERNTIKMTQFVSKFYTELFCSQNINKVSSKKVVKLLNELSELVNAIPIEVRPSFEITKDLDPRNLLKVKNIRILYYFIIWFLTNNVEEDISKTYEYLKLESCYDILDTWFGLELMKHEAENTFSVTAALSVFYYFVQRFLESPADEQSERILKYLLRTTQKICDEPRMLDVQYYHTVNYLVSYLLEPCVRIYRAKNGHFSTLDTQILEFDERTKQLLSPISTSSPVRCSSSEKLASSSQMVPTDPNVNLDFAQFFGFPASMSGTESFPFDKDWSALFP